MRYREANPIRRFLRWSAATAPMSWLYARVLHHIDRLVYRRTRGRHTLGSWLSGLPVVVASNWGQRQHPAWYHNLRAHPTATVTVGSVPRRVQAHEAIGEERERLWQRDLEVYPGRTVYERRAAHRRIPVVVLAPVSDEPA